jgi:hypothetical protein
MEIEHELYRGHIELLRHEIEDERRKTEYLSEKISNFFRDLASVKESISNYKCEIHEKIRRIEVEHEKWASDQRDENEEQRRQNAELSASLKDKEAKVDSERLEHEKAHARLEESMSCHESQMIGVIDGIRDESRAAFDQLQREYQELWREIGEMRRRHEMEKNLLQDALSRYESEQREAMKRNEMEEFEGEIEKQTEPDSESAEAEMQIRVKFVTGKEIKVSVLPSDRISEVKRKIADIEGVPVERQRIVFGGKEMDNRATLWDYSIYSGSTVYFSVRSARGQVLAESGVTFPVSVRTWTFSYMLIEVDAADCIASVKAKIADNMQTPAEEFYLIFNGRVLPERGTVCECAIIRYSTLHLSVRAPRRVSETGGR